MLIAHDFHDGQVRQRTVVHIADLQHVYVLDGGQLVETAGADVYMTKPGEDDPSPADVAKVTPLGRHIAGKPDKRHRGLLNGRGPALNEGEHDIDTVARLAGERPQRTDRSELTGEFADRIVAALNEHAVLRALDLRAVLADRGHNVPVVRFETID